ncbi:FG-GAP-like repeat-containing protein [Streptomyces sp. NPDC089919]|uniref:FG-GAP-like repeat-containing protein n=1 Tax=Streptomyces sp. NPDC089919 TaxID=3155188 RepID=UPI00343A331D
MGRNALARRRATAAALVTTSLVLGAVVLPAGGAYAGTPAPWTAAVRLADAQAALQELVVTTDGTAVALWKQYDATARLWRLTAATRPAGTDTWNAPAELATSPNDKGEAKLLARADGSVLALWTERPNATTTYTDETRVLSATLAAGAGARWSAPVTLIDLWAKVAISSLDLVEGPGGRIAAAWVSRPLSARIGEVYLALRAEDGSWLNSLPASNVGTHSGSVASGPQLALDPEGNAIVAYTMNVGGRLSLMTNTRSARTGVWRTPAALATPAYVMHTATLGSDPSGETYLVWKDPDGSLKLSRRPTADADWSEPVTAAAGLATGGSGVPTRTPEPLVAADGDITLVWYDETHRGGDGATTGIRTVSFDSDTGSWSPLRTLSTGYPATAYDVSMARDGSVHAAWLQSDPSSSTTSVQQASRIGNSWTDTRQVSYGGYERAEIASAGADRLTVAWDSGPSGSRSLWAVRAAWPQLTASPFSVPDQVDLTRSSGGKTAWDARWSTNTAVANWTMTVADPAGRTLRTLTAAPNAAGITVQWDGRTSTGAVAPNGRLKWTLKATQAGSGTVSTVATGVLKVTGGAAVHRDFGGPSDTPDGLGDVFTLSSAGRLQHLYASLPGGDLVMGRTGTGWSSSILAVPFGDLSGDRCNDLLVRSGDNLRLYKPACGAAPSASVPSTAIGAGWGQYDLLTATGDATKDGRPDLYARNRTTGALYLYKGVSGKLAARVKLAGDWRGYKRLVGAGDLNGDGIGDLLAQDKSNALWRYDGTGTGTFKARVKLSSSWGSTYNAVVAPGDLNGDGKADLIARDTAGNLYRIYGTGKGAIGSRTKVNIGFGGYKALF